MTLFVSFYLNTDHCLKCKKRKQSKEAVRSNSVKVISRNFAYAYFCPTDSSDFVCQSFLPCSISLSVTFLRTRSGESLLPSRAVYSRLCHRPIIRRCSFSPPSLSSSRPQYLIDTSIGPGPIQTLN